VQSTPSKLRKKDGRRRARVPLSYACLQQAGSGQAPHLFQAVLERREWDKLLSRLTWLSSTA